MVKCNNCGNEVAYKNRFWNYCPKCNTKITHICWKCNTEIDPTHCEAIENPISHYHLCPTCNAVGKNDDIEQLKLMITDANSFLIDNDWMKVLNVNDFVKLQQLVLTLKSERNTKYFCVKGIASGKPKNEFIKFWEGLNIIPLNVQLIKLFDDVDDFIESKPVGTTIYSEELKKSLITNSENLVLLDYFVCMGKLKKISLKPAKYIIISHTPEICSYLATHKLVQCPKCQKVLTDDIQYCPDCIYKKNGKINKKGEHYKLNRYKWKTVCSCENKTPKYWVNVSEKEGENEQQEEYN